MNVTSSLACLGTAVLLLVGSGCEAPSAAQPAGPVAQASATSRVVRVNVGRPERKSLLLSTSQPGRVEAFQETPLFSKVTGFVQTLHADIGDFVTQDQVLIDLWIPEMHDELAQKEAILEHADAQVKQAEAALEAARASVQTAQANVSQAEAGIGRASGAYQRWSSEHARIEELARKGSVNPKLVDESLNEVRSAEASQQEAAAMVASAKASRREAEANVKKAEADVVAAQAERGIAEADVSRTQTMLSYAQIKAPFDGVVTRRGVDPGHYVHPASGASDEPLMVVATTDRVRISVDVPEMEAARVDSGERADLATVDVQSLREREFEAPVTRTSWSLDPSNRSLRVEIDLPNDQGELRPGMHATVTILLEQRDDVLTLPITAIVREGRETFCHCVVDGQIERRKVKLGLRSGDLVEVISGVDQTHQVVLTGAAALPPGTRVEAIGASS